MLVAVLAMVTGSAAVAVPPVTTPTVTVVATGLQDATGSTIGPDGALYVTEAAVGEVTRIDLDTGTISTFASGLPERLPHLPLGGAMDVEFLDGTAYVLTTAVDAGAGGAAVTGIHRVDGPQASTVIADLGAWSVANPSGSDVMINSGVQYALETFRGDLLVTDGHHNRVLRVTTDGDVSEFAAFGNTVPTGLETRGRTVFMAEAGPVPHLPDDGKVVALGPDGDIQARVASGAPLLVDVEFGPGNELFALAQGQWDEVFPGSPATIGTGSLVIVDEDGALTPVVGGLDRPTSLEFVGGTAWVVGMGGTVVRIEHPAAPPHGPVR